MRILIAAVAVLSMCVSVNAAEVRSRSGIHVSVAASAQQALQCVVDHVERAGVRIKAMRGIGRGTVHGSLHPSGQALDINQTSRNRTSPHVPASVSNAAADACGVVSGARWGHADNGHWNLGQTASRHRHTRHTSRHHGRTRYASAHAAVDRAAPQ